MKLESRGLGVCHRRKASGQVVLIRRGERTTKSLTTSMRYTCYMWIRLVPGSNKKSKAVFGSRGTSPATRTAFNSMDGWVWMGGLVSRLFRFPNLFLIACENAIFSLSLWWGVTDGYGDRVPVAWSYWLLSFLFHSTVWFYGVVKLTTQFLKTITKTRHMVTRPVNFWVLITRVKRMKVSTMLPLSSLSTQSFARVVDLTVSLWYMIMTMSTTTLVYFIVI